MRRWRPAPSAGGLVGLLAFLLSLAGMAGLILRVIPGTSGAAQVAAWALVALLAVPAAGSAALLWGYYRLSYAFEDGPEAALVLRWAWVTIRIPLEEIEYLGPARQLLRPPAAAERRWLWPWPGYYLASIDDEALGRVQLLATVPPRRQLLVCSARGSFGISPDRPAQLMDHYARWREAARSVPFALPPLVPVPAQPAPPVDEDEGGEAPGSGAVPHPGSGWAVDGAPALAGLLRDRAAVGLLLLGGGLIAAMLWFILLRYEAVPSALPLHYSATGVPDRIGTPREIFILPLITALVAAANIALAWSVARFDRFAARLLLSATCLVQLVAWVALLKLFARV